MRRRVTHVYLVVLDGDHDRVEWAGPLAWRGALRDLSARAGYVVALDQYGRRIGHAECVAGYAPEVKGRNGESIEGEADAAAVIEMVERCSTSRPRVLDVGPVAMARRWHAARRERGEEALPWRPPPSA